MKGLEKKINETTIVTAFRHVVTKNEKKISLAYENSFWPCQRLICSLPVTAIKAPKPLTR